MKTNKKNNAAKAEKENFPGYPLYPTGEDIYSNAKEEVDLDPETGQRKSPNVSADSPNERNNMKDRSGDDLDVPGSELDDLQESIGSEDEENNFYSLGGDERENLEEKQD